MSCTPNLRRIRGTACVVPVVVCRPAGRSTGGAPLDAAVSCVQPADHGIEPEQLRVHHQRQAHVVLGFAFLDPRPLLHQLHQVPAVHLDHVPYVGAGHPQRHQDLHHQLVARRRGHVRGRAQPPGQFFRPGRGDPEALLRAVLAVTVGLDQPVALQPLQRGVDLAHVQRPDLPGSRLELLAQLKAVLGSLAEQREQRVPDAHVTMITSSILGILLGRRWPCQPVNPPISHTV